MKTRTHIIASVSLGAAFYLFTRSFTASLLCVVSGILIDSDHIIEFVIHFGFRDFSVRRLYQECEKTNDKTGGFPKLFLLFHSGEAVLLLWAGYLFTQNTHILAVALGYSLHLIMDAAGNIIQPMSYFIILRALKRFNINRFYR